MNTGVLHVVLIFSLVDDLCRMWFEVFIIRVDMSDVNGVHSLDVCELAINAIKSLQALNLSRCRNFRASGVHSPDKGVCRADIKVMVAVL